MKKLIFAIITLIAVSGFAGQKSLRVDTSTGECSQDVNFTGTTQILGITLPLDKRDGTTAPTVDDDAGDGYSVGSKWADVTNDKIYYCIDSTTGAAVWLDLTGAGDVTGPATSTNKGIAIWDGTDGSAMLSTSVTVDTGNAIFIDGTQTLFLPDQTDFLGSLILGVGGSSLSHSTINGGRYNTLIGIGSGDSITTGLNNVSIGCSTARSLTTGNSNIYIGNSTGGTTTASCNVSIGHAASTATGNYNVSLGYSAGPFGACSNNICIGYGAGVYRATPDNFIVDSHIRSDLADETANSLIVGKMAYAGAPNQSLRVNGEFNILGEYAFPTTDGTANYPLVTDGSGQLSFSALAVTGGGTGATTQQAAIDALTNVSGASTSQILTKDGSGNATFQDAPDGSPLTTKGDIYTYSSDNARLPVGNNDEYLVADSGETTGLKWKAFDTTKFTGSFTGSTADASFSWSTNVLSITHGLSNTPSPYQLTWQFYQADGTTYTRVGPDFLETSTTSVLNFDFTGVGKPGAGDTIYVVIRK